MAELARWCRAQSFSGVMTNAVIAAFVDLDSLRSCANDPGMVDEGLKEQGLTISDGKPPPTLIARAKAIAQKAAVKTRLAMKKQ